MNFKENKGITRASLIITILIILLLGAVAVCIYLVKNPVKEQISVQNPEKVVALNATNEVNEYTNNLTDKQNGKIAFMKLIDNNSLQTEKHNGYYTYIDPFENKYDIKEIKNVTSEEGIMGTNNWAALFKVTVNYIDNSNKSQEMELAIILLPNYDIQNQGTYLNYEGSTSYVKNFTDLYENNYNNDEINENIDRNSKDKGIEVIGLDTKFNELKDIAIYTKELNGERSSFEYDLDDDGKNNKLLIDTKSNIIKYNNDQEFENLFLKNENYKTHTVYVVDINESDKYLDIIIFSKGDSEQEYHIFKNVDGNLKLVDRDFSYGLDLNKIEAYHIYLDNNDKMLYLDEVEANLSPMVVVNYYDLSDEIQKISVNVESAINKEFKTKARIYFTTMDISSHTYDYTELKNNNEILPSGTKVKILEMNEELNDIIKVKLSDGRIGYIFPKYGHL